jgi:uncharacterized protein
MPANTGLTKLQRKVDNIEQMIREATVIDVTQSPVQNKQTRADGWYNALAGFGKSFDKSNKTYFGSFYFMDRNQLSRMYVGDGLGRKIIDCIADDMTREWVEIKLENKDDKDLLETTLKKLKVEVYFNEALKWERLFGGSIIVIGAMDGKPLDYPMLLERVQSIEWLKVVDQWDIDLPSSEWDRDPTSPTYGQILRYMCQFRVSGTGRIDRLLVHNSRVLPFYGENIPKSLVMGDQRTRYWGASVLQAVWEWVANFGGAYQGIVNILFEFIIGKYKFSNLDDMLAAGNEQVLMDRMSAIQMSKSVINAVMLGTDEDYIRDSANVSGLPDLIDRMMMMVAGVVNIPVTKLFGRSAAGMNSTGEGDIENYYSIVRGKQKTDLQPNLNKFLLLLAQVLGIEDIPTFTFNPLRQLTAKEEAELESAKAQAYLNQANGDAVYLDRQVLSPEEVALEREFITEDEFNLLRGIEPNDNNEENKLKATPGEGSAVNPKTGASEQNLLDRKTEKKPDLQAKTKSSFQQPSSAVPPVNSPGVPVY